MLRKMVFGMIFGIWPLVLASTVSAQNPPVPPPSVLGSDVRSSNTPPGAGPRQTGPGGFGSGTMPPGMMQTLGPMLGGAQNATVREQRTSGPLQRFSRLMAALDDPRVRVALGLTDEQANSLRKIIVDTETFTIRTGAVIAVDSIDLREMLRADKPDRTAVMSKGNETSKSTSDLINHYLDAMLAAKAILSPEQQKKIRTYMESGSPTFQAPVPRP